MEISEADIERMGSFLGEIKDVRRPWANFKHKLIDILVIGLCAVVSGKSEFEDMEELGEAREEWFKTFLTLENGIPDSCTFERVFRQVNPKELLKCMQGWLKLESTSGGRELNIDGKTIRGSADGERHAVHIVSVWAGEQNLVLSQRAVGEKSNEITAIPQVLDMIDIRGDTVTIDAMGCQKEIAKKIRGEAADYILMVKENHPTMYTEIEDYFKWLDGYARKDELCKEWKSGLEKDHGRIERREITVIDAGWFADKALWEDLKTIIRCHSKRTIAGKTPTDEWKTTEYDRYYISSLDADAERLGHLIRQHWSIENQQHWSLDVSFGEDASRVRKDHAPENLDILRKIALNRLRSTNTDKKLSVKRKQFRAAINQDFMHTVLFG